MNWYPSSLIKQAAANTPPPYVIERLTDLRHAIEVSKISPSNAKSILTTISSDFRSHTNLEYAEILDNAARAMLDNPAKARDLVLIAMDQIEDDLEDYNIERERKVWKRK